MNYLAILGRQLSVRKQFLRVREQDPVSIEQVLYDQPQTVWESDIIIVEQPDNLVGKVPRLFIIFI